MGTPYDKLNPKAIAKKWQRVLDFERYQPIKDQTVRENVALMLESTSRYLNEKVFASTAGGGYSPGDGDLGTDFPKLAIPLLRRVMPGLIANELVGVQPMTGPVGLAFALRFVYGSAVSESVLEGSSAEAVWAIQSGAVLTNKQPIVGSTSAYVTTGSEGWTSPVQDMKLTIAQEQLSAGSRRLRATFSLEAAQDIKALHNLDIDDELTNLLTYEIQAEIEQELIYNMIQQGANGFYAVSAAGGFAGTPAASLAYGATCAVSGVTVENVADNATTNFDNNEFYMYRGIWTRISKGMNHVAVQTRRGPANWIICSPKVLTALQSITNFLISPVPNDIDFANVAAKKVGFINNGRTAVYLDLFNTISYFAGVTGGTTQSYDYCLIGYKGASELDAGIFYAPYVPVLLVRAQDPDTFAPRLGVMSRYAIANSLLGAYRYYYLLRFNFSGTVLSG